MHQTYTKQIQNDTRLDGKDDPLWIVEEIKINPYLHMVYAQIRICPRKWNL